MRMLIWYGATAVVVTVAATMSGESQIDQTSSSNSSYIETSKLVGRRVKSSEGEEIGVIKDVVIDRTNGCMAYTVVSTGAEGTGRTSGGGKTVAVPWALYSPTSDLRVLTVNVDRDKISNAPEFEYGRIDEYARPDYINNAYSYYGVSPGSRTGVGASSGATAGTDVTGTAGATASPGEVASPAPACNRCAKHKTFSCESLWGFERESISKRNTNRDGKWYAAAGESPRNSIINHDRGVCFGKHNQPERKQKITTQSC